MIDEPYGAFAYAYDKALGERYFRAIRRMLDDMLERYPAPPGKTHLDVACGTGLAMRHFARRGFVTTGIDLSMPMLRMARGRARRLVAADARALPFVRPFSLVTCLYDALNHMLDRDDLVAAFREVARVMDNGALFVFDMNHPEIYPVVWGMKEPFEEEGEDFALEIATSWHPRKRLGRALVRGWRRLPGGERVEIRERHEQRSYDESEITAALAEASLVALETRTFDPYGEGRAVKVFCVAAQV
jgi:ubiquinone/menaquinone biosynthesis C-methylase UbiE